MVNISTLGHRGKMRGRGTFEMTAAGNHPPGLCDTIFSFLTIRELILLARTSSTMRSAVQRYTAVAWDCNVFLRYWFPYVEGFRIKLAETGAIVTGSQMIQFFDRLPQLEDSDLDILTRIGGLLPLVLYLEREGYVRVYRSPRIGREDDYPLLTEVFGVTSSPSFLRGGGKSGIIHVMDFEKDCRTRSKGKLLKVQLVVVAKSPVEHLLGFHSTGVMNFMTHKQAISIFPEATFELRKFFVTSREPLGENWGPSWVEKYTRRGFQIDRYTEIPQVEVGVRHVDDKYSWVISFSDRFCPWMREAESRCVYASDSQTTSFKFELAWVPEKSTVNARVQYRIVVLEREIWFYLWSLYLQG